MCKIPLTNRKEWIFLLGIIMFILGFWAQPFLIASNKSDMIVGITVIISIVGFALMVFLIEPQKAKYKNMYPLLFVVVIIFEMLWQILIRAVCK